MEIPGKTGKNQQSGEINHDQPAEKMGREIREAREKELEKQRVAEHFNVGYLVAMGKPDTEARKQAENFIASIEGHEPQGETPDTLSAEVVFGRGDKTITLTAKDGFEHQFEVTRADLPTVKTCLFVVPSGLAFQTTGGRWLALQVEIAPELVEGLNARNGRRGWKVPPELLARLAPPSLAPEEKQIHFPQGTLPILLSRPMPRGDGPPTPPDELLAMLPNNKAERDLGHSLMTYPANWQLNLNDAKYFCDGSEGHITEFQPDEVASDYELALGDAPQRALDTLEKRFKELRSETVADVIDILFHHWNTYKNPVNNSALITAAKLCEYRGKVPEGDNLTSHWQALRDAFSLNLRDTQSDLNAKLFFAESKGEIKDGPGARYSYSPGFMLQYALASNPLYFAPFLRKIWALDPKKYNETKRLARYLRGDWRMNTEKYLTSEGGQRAARWRKWADILADCGIDAEAHQQSPNPKRLIEAVKSAVETLYDMEVIAEGSFDIYHPDDRKMAENLPRRGALTEWLALRVCMAPSAKLREALLETDGKRRARRERDANAMATQRAKKKLRAPKNKT